MRKIKLVILLIGLFLLPIIVLAQDISYYLILQDIGIYKLFTGVPGRVFSGPPSKYSQTNTGGVLSSSDHLSDNDVSYEASYTEPASKWPFVKVEVTQHTGGDSDRWLLHEIEEGYHDDEMETLGLLTDGAVMRKIDNKRVLWLGIGGGTFRWVSNNVVVDISYTDLQGTKPEPIEVVKAYLAKFPSTITLTDAELKASAHNIQWIKDEIDRRLWLCDKWNAQSLAGSVTQADLIYNILRSMEVFLYYRQKYYGVAAQADINLLVGYKQNKDITSIQKKLTEYKTWWSKNKTKAITLP